jgi:hypothetical protein
VPVTPWSRIARDLRVTTGRELELLAEESNGGWIEFFVFIDGKGFGSFGRAFSADPEQQLAELADVLREHTLDEEIWGGWPICPVHGTHPLDAHTDPDTGATWSCPRHAFAARIGALPGHDQ